MNRGRKIFIIFTLILAAIVILYGLLLYTKKISLPTFNKSNLPDVSKLESENLPGKLFGPQEATRAQTLSADKIIEITNRYRQLEGLPSLQKNDLLTNAAQTKANDMFQKQYFDHVSPTGTTPAQLVLTEGYNYKITGENLALGDFKDEVDLVDAWMASPGHRANIMSKDYIEIGVSGILNDYQGRTTWISVQEFGAPAPNCPKPDQNLSKQIDSKKQQYTSLSNQLTVLSTQAQSLADQANQQIDQGNAIYAETGDQTQAQPYWDQGEALRAQSEAKINEAKSIDEQLKTLYGQIDILIARYNKQVSSYNECIKK